jgi:membrane-bound lytic murein transglycosylase B
MPRALLCLLLLGLCLRAHATGEYNNYEELQALIEQMEQDKVYRPGELAALFSQVNRQDKVLTAIARPAESVKEWKDYRPGFLTADRIQGGVDFWSRNQQTLDRAARAYGVPPEIVVAIIGVETKYGSSTGRFRVLDTLSTLAFDYPPRAPFFRNELHEYLQLAHEAKLDPLNVYGSYAGAMGFGQFMPSSWRNFAVDFDGDGRVDIINSPIDAIGSVAHYFKGNGWQTGEPVAIRAHIISQGYDAAISKDLSVNSTLGEIAQKGLIPRDDGIYLAKTPASAIRLQGDNGAEFWLAFNNFYVITKYNRSTLYAMAVLQLSQAIKAAHDAPMPAPVPAAGTPAAAAGS